MVSLKSEYEQVKGACPIVDPIIRQCATYDGLRLAVNEDLAKLYEQQPVIVICDDEQRGDVLKSIVANKMKYLDQCSEDMLDSIRQCDYGVLVLNPQQGRGIDTRFQRDAHVMVLAKVTSYHELKQMVGRSSRTRGVCQGTLYVVSEDRAVHIMDKLKKHGIVSLQELEKLLIVLERRAKDQTLLKLLIKLRGEGIVVNTTEQLNTHLDEATFNNIVRVA